MNECPDCGCDLDQPHNEHIGLDGPDEKGPCSCENTAHTKAVDAE